uniref:Uncharacterized protein n=1 Tax=Globisporangium ultimum (strain ATCC 200006 / CBS 805.95 / DAOM BR144) TaxID=431595 RepID=K3WBC0_GLOUD
MSPTTSGAEDANALDPSGSNAAFPHGVESVDHDARAASVAAATAAGFGVSVLSLETHPLHQFQQGAVVTASSSPPPSSVAVATAELVVQHQNAPPPKRKGGRAKDAIWNETTIMEDKTVVCNHCSAVIHKYGCAKVERVRAHFQNRCLQSANYQNRNVHAAAVKKQKTAHSPSNGNSDAVNRRGAESVGVAKVGLFKRKFTQWVYATGQAFDDMENEFLVNALCTLRPDVPLPSRDELENELLELECNATQAKVNKALSGNACILAIEHWTNASGVVHTNYVALCDNTPYLLECTTSSQTQDAAAEIPVEELEAVLAKHKKCAFYAIVTTEKAMLSNATCERIQKKYLQCVFYYGCVRHALRLLVNDITATLPWLEKTRDSVTELLRVVQGSYKLQLQVPGLPRIGADGNLGSLLSYEQVFDALEAILSSEKELYAVVSRRDFVEASRSPVEKEQRKRIQDFVLGETFVNDVNNALKLVRPLQQQLLRVESDRSATLSQVYHCFVELLDTYVSMEWVSKKDKALISSCVKERFHSIYGDAHGVAYMLDPLYLGEHLDAAKKSEVEAFITLYCNGLEPEKILTQLEKYKAMVHELKECNSTYWKMLESGEVRTFDFWIERRQFPQLQQLAWAVFSLPNASTTPSKSFSAQCQLIHSKFQTKLSAEKLQRLTQVNCNAKSVAATSADGAELSPLGAVADATTFASNNPPSAIL